MTTTFDHVGGIHSTPGAACGSCGFLEGAPLAWVVLVVAFLSLVRSSVRSLVSSSLLPSFFSFIDGRNEFSSVRPHPPSCRLCMLAPHAHSLRLGASRHNSGHHVRRSRWVVYHSTLVLARVF
ncbi:hypothetical protein DFP72DRAFT_881938 [Ephemerocybe angulata]|uniref:Uncharacterized protein n=1 Tax=Ephemerocybe angulata TaxID=980116 RepID=A0A8H6M9L1_9AGAR|nr:hypothetical protein DFP72DRAFT_881938 [Tulosesus angulatus]